MKSQSNKHIRRSILKHARSGFILVIVLCLLFVGNLQAQSAREMAARDLLAMQQPFASSESWVVQSEVRMYDAPAGGNLLETAGSTIMQSGGQRYEKHEQMEYLLSTDYHLILDHEWKTLSVAPRQDSRKAKAAAMVSAETMLKGCDRVESLAPEKGVKGYAFFYPAGEYEKIEMHLDAGTGKCKSLVYHFREPLGAEEGGCGQKPRMEVRYTKTDFKPSFPSDQFSIRRYCTVHGNTLRPVAALSDYQILN